MEKKIKEKCINKATKLYKDIREKMKLYNSKLEIFENLGYNYIPTPFEIADAYNIRYQFIVLDGEMPSYCNKEQRIIYISKKYRKESYQAKFLCAHELGHFFMQKNKETAAMNNDILNRFLPMEIQKEYEANVFALMVMPQFMSGKPWEYYSPQKLNNDIYNKVFFR